jgi:hypothetical protein
MPSGGKRDGAGRKALPLIERKVKRSVTLSLTAIEAVNERMRPGEEFSTTLDRILNALPIMAPPLKPP